MALSSTEESQVRALVAQNAALLSLAASEATIISKLSATKVSLADLTPASSLNDADLFLVRQGVVEKSVTKSILTPDASESTKGIIRIADTAIMQAGTDNARSATAAGVRSVYGRMMQDIDYTLSGNALTLRLNPTTLAFRSTTLTSGAPTLVSNAAQITTTISSGSTGGTTSGVQSEIAILAINNAGTVELAWVNVASGLSLDGGGLISTTAEGGAGAADSINVIYSTTARTNVAYRVVGVFRSTQTTAGTWAQTPSLVQSIDQNTRYGFSDFPVPSIVRLHTANGFGSTNTMIRRYQTVDRNQGTDITYADSATLGASFTINSSGVYAVYIDWDSTSSSYQGVSVNSNQLTTSIVNINLTNRICYSVTIGVTLMSTGATIYLNAGDVVRPHTDGVATGANSRNSFIIVRVA